MRPSVSVTWRRSTDSSPILMAHRSAPTEQPENTLASFHAALAAGANVIEMDVRTTADGELVVIHDPTVDRTSSSQGAISALTLADLRAIYLRSPQGDKTSVCQIPRLEEVFKAFPTAAMNVDLSAVSATDVPRVFAWIRDVKKQPGANLQVLLTSSSAEIQHAIATNNQAEEVVLGMGRQDVLDVLKAAWLRRPPIERLRGRACQMPAHLNVLGVNVPLLIGPLPAYLRQMNCPLHVWWDTHGMIDDEFRLKKCKQWGVDGIFTNEIKAMVALSKPAEGGF